LPGRFDTTVTKREFEITEFEPPSKIRWKETSKNLVSVPEGGYDLSPAGEGKTRLTLFNEFEGHGIGRLFAPLALRGARASADDFGQRIKAAVEAS
jgi:hypothetical protein